jgi:hypothetical protein
MAISGVVGAIYKAQGTSTAFSAEAMTNSGDNMRYAITNAAKAYWDNTAAVTVEKSTNGGGSWAAVTTGFTIEYAGGNIVFTASQGTALFRTGGKYLTAAAIGGGFNWKCDVEADMLECTTFASAGWKEYVPGLGGFSGSFEKYWLDGTTFADIGNDTLILVLYVDAGASKLRYEGYAEIKTDSLETPNDDLVKTSVDFQGSGKLYYRAG